jgi:hypothetical protein
MEVTKVCRACNKEKTLKAFNTNRKYIDDLEPRCKICKKNGVKIRVKKPKESDSWSRYFKLGNPSKEDFCVVYDFFSVIGYDLSKDIHLQFCEKYDLTPRPRHPKQKNRFSVEDCK